MPPYYTWTLTGRLCPKRLLLEQRGNYFTYGWPYLIPQKYEDEENNKDNLMITMTIVWWWHDDKSTGNGCGQGCPTTDWLVSRTDSLSHIYCPRKTILISITKTQIKVKVIMKIIIIEIPKIKKRSLSCLCRPWNKQSVGCWHPANTQYTRITRSDRSWKQKRERVYSENMFY